MSRQSKVFILVLAGQERDALAFARRRYPGRETVILSKSELRESGWKNQLRQLRQLQGEALLIFTDSLESLREPMLLRWTVLVHGCQETVIADSSEAFVVSSKTGLLSLLPQTLIAALADLIVFAVAWIGLKLFQVWLKLGREPEAVVGALDLAFLYPSQAGLNVPGGALTHVTGFLAGLAQEGARSTVLAGQPALLERVLPGRRGRAGVGPLPGGPRAGRVAGLPGGDDVPVPHPLHRGMLFLRSDVHLLRRCMPRRVDGEGLNAMHTAEPRLCRHLHGRRTRDLEADGVRRDGDPGDSRGLRASL